MADRAGVGLSCVVNISEGRDTAVVQELEAASGEVLVDLHADPEHHRSVFTLASLSPEACEEAARRLVRAAVSLLDLRYHAGHHPRLGVVDVVPFVPLLLGAGAAELETADLDRAVAARDRFAAFAAEELSVPSFRYGPLPDGEERSLPTIRKLAFAELRPDCGPPFPDPRAGALCVGARRVLVAYNLFLGSDDLETGRRLVRQLRSNDIRALAFPLRRGVQVSCNLVAPWRTGPEQVRSRLAGLANHVGTAIVGCELVGLVPRCVLEAVAPERRAELDLREDATLEARISS